MTITLNKWTSNLYLHILPLAASLLLVGVELGPVPGVLGAGRVLPQRRDALDEAGADIAIEPPLHAGLFALLAKVLRHFPANLSREKLMRR